MGLACCASWPCVLNVTCSHNTNRNFTRNLDQEENFRRFPDANNEELKIKTKRLESKKADLVGSVHADKRNNEMKEWIYAVEDVCRTVNALLSTKVSELKNDNQKVKFAFKVFTVLNLVKELISQGDKWDSYIITPEQSGPSTSSGTCQAVGFENKLNEVLDLIAGEGLTIIGILGAGGIGKTRLLEEIKENFNNNHRNPTPRFTKVILVHVPKTRDEARIQEVIGKGLGIGDFSGLEFEKRAESLSKALSEETCLIMLDDIWHGFNVHAIGIPRPKVNLNCKIVYTTRFKSICTGMGPHKIIEMEYLDLKASLKLFQNARMFPSVGNLETDYKIVRKCSGLPLALVIVGRATASGSPEDIYKAMSESPSDIESMEDDVLKVLKPSFDALTDEVRQRCFLFCGLFQDFKDINREQLLEYWIGEKLIGDNEFLVRLRDKATNHVENLVGSCLLEEAPDLKHVKMHNIVRSMAVWLANHDTDMLYANQGKDRFYVGEEFNHIVFEKMKRVERLSLIDVEMEKEQVLRQAPCCPSLMTLLMALNGLRSEIQGRNGPRDGPWKYTIPSLFFKDMPSIHVLDLTGHPITGLPKAICDLKSLHYLNLSFTYIEMISEHFNRLTNLRQLDLTGTSMLKNIPFKAISSLSNLMSFKLYGSSYKISFSNRTWLRKNWNSQLSLNDLEKLLGLQELSLSLQEIKILQRLSDSRKLLKLTNCLQLACIRSVSDIKSLFELLENFKNLKTLCLKNCDFKDETIVVPSNLTLSLKILELRDLETVRSIICGKENGKSSLEGLWELRIVNCKELMNINCLCQLKGLQIFRIEACPNIVGFHEDKDHKMCLSELKLLRLRNLPKLISISQSAVQIGSLKNMIIQQCSRLLNLPEFENQTEKIGVSCEEGWWYSLEGQNNNPESLFKPHFPTTAVQTNEIQGIDDQSTSDQIAEDQFEVKKDKGKGPLYPNPPTDEDSVHQKGPSQFGALTTEIVQDTAVPIPEAQTTEIVQAIDAQTTDFIQAIQAQSEAQLAEIIQAPEAQGTDVESTEPQTTEVQAKVAQNDEVIQSNKAQISLSQNEVTTAAAHNPGKDKGQTSSSSWLSGRPENASVLIR